MMIETFIAMTRYLSGRKDDDWADRLNYLFTPNILLAFSVIISFKQFGGHPIECMFPNKFPGSWEQYAENLCWSQDTYYVQPTQHVELVSDQERNEEKLQYYQWVPFFLLFQALCFRVPSLLWKTVHYFSGLRIHELLEKASEPENLGKHTRRQNIKMLAEHLTGALAMRHRVDKGAIKFDAFTPHLKVTYSPMFITTCYVLCKFLYIVNVMVQLFLMNFFLGTDKFDAFGFKVIRDLVNGVKWDHSGFFPRTTICDFSIRQVANIQNYSVQCVLVINIFNEKIFVFLWFWYALIVLVSAWSLIQWFALFAFPCFSPGFIAEYLALADPRDFKEIPKTNKEITNFVKKFLRRDGVFVLRMVVTHAGQIFATDLVVALYNAYHRIQLKGFGFAAISDAEKGKQRNSNMNLSVRKRKGKKSLASLDSTSLLQQKSSSSTAASSSSSEEDDKKKTQGAQL